MPGTQRYFDAVSLSVDQVIDACKSLLRAEAQESELHAKCDAFAVDCTPDRESTPEILDHWERLWKQRSEASDNVKRFMDEFLSAILYAEETIGGVRRWNSLKLVQPVAKWAFDLRAGLRTLREISDSFSQSSDRYNKVITDLHNLSALAKDTLVIRNSVKKKKATSRTRRKTS